MSGDVKKTIKMSGVSLTGPHSLRIPGDKSVSQRLALLSGISSGSSTLTNYLKSEDCLNTLHAMAALGATVAMNADGDPEVTGAGGALQSPAKDLDLGNSGTGMRLMTGLLSGQSFSSTLTGDASLCSRPMKRIQAPLSQMGAQIQLTDPRGTAPIHITGSALQGIEYVLPMASAQVKSAILLAGLYADGETRVIEPAETRDHTEKLFLELGLPLEVEGLTMTLQGFGPKGPQLTGRDWLVPGDFSSAAFWLVLAAASPGADLTLEDVGLNPRRTALLDVLKNMGADIDVELADTPPGAEAQGRIRVRGAALRGVEIGGDVIANLIDEIPIIAVAAAFAEGRTVIRDAAELRVKESDRIRNMVENLTAAGVNVVEQDDGMILQGPNKINSSWSAVSQGDHRVVMAMAVLSSVSGTSCLLEDTTCTETSYPGFWEQLENTGSHVEQHRA